MNYFPRIKHLRKPWLFEYYPTNSTSRVKLTPLLTTNNLDQISIEPNKRTDKSTQTTITAAMIHTPISKNNKHLLTIPKSDR